MNQPQLEKYCRFLRHFILRSTTTAGSGHPTTCLSATELTATLFFGGYFRADLDHPDYANNDRFVLSKGHAAPLLYALYLLAGKITVEEILQLRKFDSPLEGHPTKRFPFTEAATGSLGQGLSAGVGIALNGKYLDRLPYRAYVLLGDSEMAEGSVWEAMALAAYYKLDNLTAVIDVNRLGQSRETMHGHDIKVYEKKAAAFGWHVIAIDGHDLKECDRAFSEAANTKAKPTVIIAKTEKGHGVSFLANKEGWHGKPVVKEDLEKALAEIGEVDSRLTAPVAKPEKFSPADYHPAKIELKWLASDSPMATRKAYGDGLAMAHAEFPEIVAIDAEVSNSTYAEIFAKQFPDRFFEMFIAEQNMAGVALGLSSRGKIPFCSTFAAFFTRAFDQIRMSQYSGANIKFVGSHAGVSIGPDGPSQMGLEDIAMFRSLPQAVVLYPSDAVSMVKLVREAAKHQGIVYIRTTRNETPRQYPPDEEFEIGGAKVVKKSSKDVGTIVTAGITLFEALKAYEELLKDGINVRVIDLYSVQPIDEKILKQAAEETKFLLTVEDHYPAGGIGEATRSAAPPGTVVRSLAVTKMPRSGSTAELLAYEEIDAAAMVQAINKLQKIIQN